MVRRTSMTATATIRRLGRYAKRRTADPVACRVASDVGASVRMNPALAVDMGGEAIGAGEVYRAAVGVEDSDDESGPVVVAECVAYVD